MDDLEDDFNEIKIAKNENLFRNNILKKAFKEYLNEAGIKSHIAFSYFLVEKIIDDFFEDVTIKSDIRECVVDKTNDGGIDAFYFNERKKELSILQSKYSFNLSKNVIDIELSKIEKSLSNIFQDNIVNFHRDLANKIRFSKLNKIDRKKIKIFIYIASLDMPKDLEKSINDKSKRMCKALEIDESSLDIKLLNEELIKNNYEYNEGWQDEKPCVFSLDNEQDIMEIKDKNGEISLIISPLKGEELAELYVKTNRKILDLNVRGAIKNKSIDTRIDNTLKNEPDNFVLLNNGLTVLADFDPDSYRDCKILRFRSFSVLNGGQTMERLYKNSDFYKSNRKIIMGEKLTKNLENVKVLAKIIPRKGNNLEEISEKISLSSNSQKPIKAEDFWSNDKKVKEIEKIMKENYFQLILKRKRGKEEFNNKPKKIANFMDLKEFAQVFNSFMLFDPKNSITAPVKIFESIDEEEKMPMKKIIGTLCDEVNVGFFRDAIYLWVKIENFKKLKTAEINKLKKDETFNPESDGIYEQVIKKSSFNLVAIIGSLYVFINLDNEKQKNIYKYENYYEFYEELKKEMTIILKKGSKKNLRNRFLYRGSESIYQKDDFYPEQLDKKIEKLLNAIIDRIANSNNIINSKNVPNELRNPSFLFNILTHPSQGLFIEYMNKMRGEKFKETVDSIFEL